VNLAEHVLSNANWLGPVAAAVAVRACIVHGVPSLLVMQQVGTRWSRGAKPVAH